MPDGGPDRGDLHGVTTTRTTSSIVANPYPVYARLREEAPIYYNERYDFWAMSRHADVEKALSDWETFSNSRSDILELVQSDFDMPKGVMMFEDPPDAHDAARADVAGVHAAADGGDRGPDPAVLRGLPGPAGRVRTGSTSSPNSPR